LDRFFAAETLILLLLVRGKRQVATNLSLKASYRGGIQLV